MNYLYGISNIYNGRILSRKVREGRYDYGYDSFGRLTEAAFSGNDLADYSTEYSYDANITGLIRKGVVDRAGKSKIYGILDATGVTLEGNRAVGYDIESDGDVFEGRTGFGNLSGYCEVQYDDNGNVAYDETTMTAYSYNRHNKPVLIEADDGSSLSFEYDGTGTLISRTQTGGGITTKTEYIGPYELVDGVFKAAYFDGGYFDADGMVHYYVPDYQGNIIADVTAGGEIVQTASYYPYGEPWLEPEGDNRRLYSGKERLNFGALRHSDYGPRLLDTRSGRWNSQDAYGEDFYQFSPYTVCGADPINYVDRDGNRFTPASMPAVNRLLAESLIGILSSKIHAVDYAQAFTETMIMQASDQLFHISAVSPLGNTGATIYDSEMDAVTFVIPGGAFGPLGLIAHEFKHGYQFLNGEIDLAIEGLEPNGSLFYDLSDEIEAYGRGALFNADKFSISEIAESYSYLPNSKKSVSNLLNNKSDWRNLPWADKVQGLKNWATKANRVFRFNNVVFKPNPK